MKLLTCTDGSRTADGAVRFSGLVGMGLSAETTLLHVKKCDSPLMCDLLNRRRDDSDRILAHGAEILKGLGVDAITKTRSGRIDAEILAEADEGQYDLITIGSEGVKGIEMFFFGALSYRLIEKVKIPVLVVKKERPRLAKVLLCTGGSAYSEKALAFGGKIAHAAKAQATLLHVVDEKACWSPGGCRKGREHLQTGLRILKEQGLDADELLREGPCSKTILETAQNWGYDLIVMGAHGMDPMKMLVSGSVVYDVLKQTRIPCLIVK
jgi:nucleotide-binding universal stress UspA family protein